MLLSTKRQGGASFNRHHALHLFARGVQHQHHHLGLDLLGHLAFEAVAIGQNPKHRAEQAGRDAKRDQRKDVYCFLHRYKKAPRCENRGRAAARLCEKTCSGYSERVFDAKLYVAGQLVVGGHEAIFGIRAQFLSDGHVDATLARKLGVIVATIRKD